MPNWAYNSVAISGPSETLARFIKAVGLDCHPPCFDFGVIIPMPKDLDVGAVSGIGEAVADVLVSGPVPDDLDAHLASSSPALQVEFEAALREYLPVAINGMTPRYKQALAEVNRSALPDAKTYLAGMKQQHPAEYADGEQYAANIRQYGHASWYGWHIQHWGTKWNACSVEVVEEEGGCIQVRFDTAWSSPVPIFEQIPKVYPGLEVEVCVEYEGEDGQHSATYP